MATELPGAAANLKRLADTYIEELSLRFPPVISGVITGYLGPGFKGALIREQAMYSVEPSDMPVFAIPYGVYNMVTGLVTRSGGGLVALPDGRVVCATDSSIAIWEPLLDRLERYPTEWPTTALLALPDGRFISLHQSAISVWSTVRGSMRSETYHIVDDILVKHPDATYIGPRIRAWEITHILSVNACTIAAYGQRRVIIIDLSTYEIKAQQDLEMAARATVSYWRVLPSEYFDAAVVGERVVYLSSSAGGMVVKCYGTYEVRGYHRSGELIPLADDSLLSVTEYGPYQWWPKWGLLVPVANPTGIRDWFAHQVYWVLDDGQIAERLTVLGGGPCCARMRARAGEPPGQETISLGEELATIDDDGAIVVWDPIGGCRRQITYPAAYRGFIRIVSIGTGRMVAQTSNDHLVLFE